jgi:hypothetical protein
MRRAEAQAQVLNQIARSTAAQNGMPQLDEFFDHRQAKPACRAREDDYSRLIPRHVVPPLDFAEKYGRRARGEIAAVVRDFSKSRRPCPCILFCIARPATRCSRNLEMQIID